MLLEHLPLFLLSQALVSSGEEGGGNGGKDSKGRRSKRRRKSQCRRRRKLKRSNMNRQQIQTPFHFWYLVFAYRGYMQGHEYIKCVYKGPHPGYIVCMFLCIT